MDYSFLDEDEGCQKAAEPVLRPEDVEKDPTFYRDSGDTVFLVEQTLFKIHRAYVTEPEDSAFRNMFRIPQSLPNSDQPESIVEGTGDEHPIHLHDTAQEFRALCNILYAPAWQDRAKHTDTIDCVSIASISNKYSFQSLEKWASDLLISRCFSTMKPKTVLYATTCSEGSLEQLLELSIRLQHRDFQTKLEDQWISRLEAGNEGMKLATAIHVGERLGLRSFLGRLYYIAVIATSKDSAASATGNWTQAALTYPPDLSSDQQTIICNGLAAMTILWDGISREYISDMDNSYRSYSSNSSECALAQLPCADILGRLQLILDPRNSWTALQFRQPDILQQMYDYHSQNLDLHFLGPAGNVQNP